MTFVKLREKAESLDSKLRQEMKTWQQTQQAEYQVFSTFAPPTLYRLLKIKKIF